MKELTNEGKVKSGLPLLDDGHFETAIVGSFSVYWDGCPDIQVIVFPPVAQSELSLYKSFIGELKVLSGATVLSVKGVMHSRANVELGLHVHDVGETKVDGLRLEKWS